MKWSDFAERSILSIAPYRFTVSDAAKAVSMAATRINTVIVAVISFVLRISFLIIF
ncbi:hypothetical protein D3C73_1594740 [compost metagenome]